MNKVEIYRCECCGRVLDESKMVWLEKSFRTNRWYKAETCPPDESQGNFPFGVACARKIMKQNKRRD